MNDIRDITRNAAAAEMFALMASEEKAELAMTTIQGLSDDELDRMGGASAIPDDQLPIYRDIMRGKSNPAMDRLGTFEDELKTGDVVLMTGTANSSKLLAGSQKVYYANARSSHVAVVHADFICIDAMPDIGVSNRLVSDVLATAEADWRVIRFDGLSDLHVQPMQKSCAHYIAQPYKITLKRKRPKEYSYCSELARKVFEDCGIEGTHIPGNVLVKPCDFDRIADAASGWTDVTERVKPYMEFSIEYAPLLRVFARSFIDGLKLNRSRYEQRRQLLKMIETRLKRGKISPESAAEMTAKIREIEESMNFTFWDFKAAKASPAETANNAA